MTAPNRTLRLLVLAMLTLLLGSCAAIEAGLQRGEQFLTTVNYPETYSISYEVTQPNGTIHTIEQSQDAQGNVSFSDGKNSWLFLRDGEQYALYQQKDGQWLAAQNPAYCDADTLRSITEPFRLLAERSLQQYLPGMSDGTPAKMLGRPCTDYSIRVGTQETGVTYLLTVDDATGICLRWQDSMEAFGHDLGSDNATFVCTQFQTDDISPLSSVLENAD